MRIVDANGNIVFITANGANNIAVVEIRLSVILFLGSVLVRQHLQLDFWLRFAQYFDHKA